MQAGDGESSFRLALGPPPVPIPDCCKVESIGENPRLLLRIENGFAGRPLRTPREQLRRPDDGRAAFVAAHFVGGVVVRAMTVRLQLEGSPSPLV
jgi:hypothetical protein